MAVVMGVEEGETGSENKGEELEGHYLGGGGEGGGREKEEGKEISENELSQVGVNS